jgi:hypothetical protein
MCVSASKAPLLVQAWYRRGGAKRRGGRSHTVSRTVVQSVLKVADIPPVRMCERIAHANAEANPKHAGIKPAATSPLQREPGSRGLYARVFRVPGKLRPGISIHRFSEEVRRLVQ